MVWSSLRSLIRLQIPEINSTSVISDANLLIITNLVCKEFIALTEAIPTFTRFNATSGTQTYDISSVATSFLRIRKEGLWWYKTDKWAQLTPYTLAKLNNDFPNWLNASAGSPLRYAIEGNTIYIHPKPDTTDTTNGFRIYHLKQSTDMSADTHYPYTGSTTEYPYLSHYDEVLVWGVKYKVYPMMGKGSLGEEAKQMFYAKCATIKKELQYRPDIIPELRHYNMQGIRARSAYSSGR